MPKTLQLLLCYLLIFAGFTGYAQQITIVDKTTLQSIPLVTVICVPDNIGLLSNAEGKVDLPELPADAQISFQMVGYQTVVLNKAAIEADNFRVMLTEKSYDLNEVVVSASRFEEKKIDVPQQVQVIKAKDIAFQNQQTSADLLTQTGNVFVQKSQMGGGSPILRGFEANKVLIVVDGVRMNNAIFRGGHLQNVITLDNTILDKVEVVFGPGSVVYGSDALGGVMHFHTRKPVFAEQGGVLFKANAFTRYASANQEKTGHFDFNIGLKRWAFLTSATYSDFGDLRQGGARDPFYGNFGKRFFYAERINGQDVMVQNQDPNVQRESGYTQLDLMQKIAFQQSDKLLHTLNFQYSTSSNIPRYDRLSEVNATTGILNFAKWYYGPQNRLMAAYHLDWSADRGLFSKARITVAYQQIEESRFTRRFGSSNLQGRIEQLDILTVNADFSKVLQKHELRYGAEYTKNQVRSTARATNINTGAVSSLDTRYPDGGSSMQSVAVYFTHTWEISPKLILTDGVRYSFVELQAKFNDKTFFPFPFSNTRQANSALNGNLGLIWMPEASWRVAVLGSTGFRAPNVDDLSKVFESVTGSVIVPNPNLRPEYTYNAELTLSKVFAGKVRVEANGYYTWYRDAITTQPFLFQGQSVIDYNGQPSLVRASVNAQRAFVYGGSLQVAADITSSFSITSSINYTYARIKTDTTDYPLDHIPPIFGKTSLNLNLKKFRGEVFALYNGWKNLPDYNLVGEDNIQYATPFGMPAWFTLNVRSSYQINQYVQLQLAVENITDQNYRVFASGISGAGRNFMITLRARI